MKSQNNEVTITTGSTSFILFVVFLILKLCNVINWSWLWVTSPLWIPVGLLAAFFIVVGIISGIYIFIKSILG